jgi:hypothetical protein
MNEDIEQARKAIQDMNQGFASMTRIVINTNFELTPEEKTLRRDATRGVEQLLWEIVDLGALAVALRREEQNDRAAGALSAGVGPKCRSATSGWAPR